MTRAAGIALVVLMVALDQAIKYWVETSLPLQQAVEVLPFFALYRTYNTGIAFSFLSGFDDTVLIALTACVMAFVLWLWARSEPSQVFARLGFAFVIGGAIGNLIDRVMLGHVVDYVLLHAGNWSFAVFNLADSFITVGAGLIVLDEILQIMRERRQKCAAGDGQQGE